jgi:hypothetical protein
MSDDAGVERGEDDEPLMMDSIFPVSESIHRPSPSHTIHPQEPPRPPSPEPTIAVYERSVIDDPTAGSAPTAVMEHDNGAARREPPTLGPLPVRQTQPLPTSHSG